MFTRKHTALVALAACALALAALGSAKKPVTRPLKATANAVITMHFDTWTWEMVDWGEATHMGRWTDTGGGELDENGNTANGTGTMVAANGDRIFWSYEPERSVYIGGTGRFERATGGANIAWISGPDQVWLDEDHLLFVGTYAGDGEITY